MRTFGHIVTSAGISLANYATYRSRPAAFASFLVGWLIDLDHVVDYVSAHGWKPNWQRFNEACHEKYSGKLYLPLHSFELVALFFLFFRGKKRQPYRVGITLSILTHLLLDQRCNPSRKPLTYFLADRIRKGFDAQAILGTSEHKHLKLVPKTVEA
jgi:membrane-bound metal-dependent hydrolase YbcI (DUF457 family)